MTVVRTRLVAQSGRRRYYDGTLDAARKMYAAEGRRAFFRGIVPTFYTVAPYTGFQFGFYTFFTQLFNSVVSAVDKDEDEAGLNSISMSGSLVCGGLAGLCAKTAVYPFDTTKKRLQVEGFAEARATLGKTGAYKGMMDCMKQIVASEGARGLFKGLGPGLLKAVATTSINFWLYEYAIRLIALRHYDKGD